jgi:predicted O-linked N-acetylglucosamine transferase (SPINDLY family)
VLDSEPRNVTALHLLWAALSQQGDFPAALEAITSAVRYQPHDAALCHSLGAALMNVGQVSEAENAYRQALKHRPDFAEAHFSLGHLLEHSGRLPEAEQSLRTALRLAPNDYLTHNHLGMVLSRLSRPNEAAICFRQALAINPNSPHAYSNLGAALCELGQPKEAAESCRRALRLNPGLAAAHTGLGNALTELASLEESAESHREAIRLDPRAATAHAGLAKTMMHMGRLAEAESAYRRALALDAGLPEAHSSLIFALDLQATTTVKEAQEERRRWSLQHAQRYALTAGLHQNGPDPDRKLRVGYVSADFRRHSAYYTIAPVIRRHDKTRFEVFCYSGVKREDDATQQVRQAVHGWRSTLGVSDDALAEQVRQDGIDILVDLSGHMAGQRLLAFARKPAPIQVTAWGYANGTGLKTMDYLFADEMVVPQAERPLFAEEIFDLPSVLCYEPPEYMPQISPLPASTGAPFTFGCVNRLEKITDEIIVLWGRILAGAPDSLLLVKDVVLDDIRLRQAFLRRLQDAGGISSERAVLLGRSTHAEHLTVFKRIDIGLDPFPHGGGISTAEAFHMGVPVVALRGATVPSRFTASLLNLLQMQDWVAESEEDYVRIALQKKQDLNELAAIRRQLRARVLQSPHGDLERYVRAVEDAYRQMWKRWCDRHTA